MADEILNQSGTNTIKLALDALKNCRREMKDWHIEHPATKQTDAAITALEAEATKPTGNIDEAAEQLRRWLSGGLVEPAQQNALRLVIWAAKNLKVKE